MQHHDNLPVRIAALLNINLMTIANAHHPLIEGLDLRIKIRACALLTCDPVHVMTI